MCKYNTWEERNKKKKNKSSGPTGGKNEGKYTRGGMDGHCTWNSVVCDHGLLSRPPGVKPLTSLVGSG